MTEFFLKKCNFSDKNSVEAFGNPYCEKNIEIEMFIGKNNKITKLKKTRLLQESDKICKQTVWFPVALPPPPPPNSLFPLFPAVSGCQEQENKKTTWNSMVASSCWERNLR